MFVYGLSKKGAPNRVRPNTHGQSQCNKHSAFGNQDQQPGSATKISRQCLHQSMTHLLKLPAWLWIALALSLDANALVVDTSGNPYLGIADRNIFRLKSPQRQPPSCHLRHWPRSRSLESRPCRANARC